MRWRLALAVAIALAIVQACTSFGAAPYVDPQVDGAAPADALASDAEEAGSLSVPCRDRAVDPAHFCDDFDGPGDVLQKWTRPITSDGGSLGPSDAGIDGSRALVARLPTATTTGRAQLLKVRHDQLELATKSKIKLSFWMRVDASPYPIANADYMIVAVLKFEDPGCPTSGGSRQREIDLQFSEDGSVSLAVKGLRGTCPDYQDKRVPYGVGYFTASPTFRHVIIEVASTPCPGAAQAHSVSVAIDDGPPTCLPVLNPFVHGDTLDVALGLYGGGPYAETRITYDDVSLDLD